MDAPWWTDEPIPAGAGMTTAEPAKATPWRTNDDKPVRPRPVSVHRPAAPAVYRPTAVTRFVPIAFLCLFAAVMVVYLAWVR